MADKSPQAFRTIREVADWLGVEAHVLRFWESKFNQIKPVKRAGGRRYYRPGDMQLVGGIKVLLHDEGMTIRGVQKILREDGIGHVAALSPSLDEDTPPDETIEETVAADAPLPHDTAGLTEATEEAQMAENGPAEDLPEITAAEAPSDPPAPVPGAEPPEAGSARQNAPEAPVAAEEDPAPEATAPIPEPAVATTESTTATETAAPLTELRALLLAAGPLSPRQRDALTAILPRIEAHAARLRARHAAE
ncbi:MerR family transcriptional regulator [Nioella nitratireducens]|uniref:MerR family transcriptional regulator n=1 Tax=Nioella nitratireducens TaxID=1287720 RepID=UPI0008FCE6D1|nr:MerR family transcriptional regulator [Nioella nitratireducens]